MPRKTYTDGRHRHSMGYWLRKSPSHPFANKDGFVPEHRLVMEGILGRIIDPRKEHVHHKDKDKKNNDPSNLQVLSIPDHRKIEVGWYLKDGVWQKPCRKCGKVLPATPENFYQRSTGGFVSICHDCCVIVQKENYSKISKEVSCKVCGNIYRKGDGASKHGQLCASCRAKKFRSEKKPWLMKYR